MPLTRQVMDARLVARARAALVAAGMSVATDGTNPDLNEPAAIALEAFGLAAADPTHVSDADLAHVPDALVPRFLAYADLQIWEIAYVAPIYMSDQETWPSYSHQWTNGKSALLQALQDRRKAFFATWNHSGGMVVGPLPPGTTHQIDERGYWSDCRHRRRLPL